MRTPLAAFFNSPTSRNLEAPMVQSDMMGAIAPFLKERSMLPERASAIREKKSGNI
jgi:hypothetical protein